jgi:catechol 2,3-dioxygenase-like lactoylglutathione lyase family enzyme
VSSPNIRYIVHDVEQTVAFYTQKLGFTLDFHPAPGFAIVSLDGVRVAFNAPGGPGGASQPMPDGRMPAPGGWNRIILEVENLEERVAALRADGAKFRGEIIVGIGGNQILLEDPSGNPVELFEPKQ